MAKRKAFKDRYIQEFKAGKLVTRPDPPMPQIDDPEKKKRKKVKR